MSDEKINFIKTPNHSITPNLNYYGTRTRVEFNGSFLEQDKVKFNHGKVVNIYIVYEISKSINIRNYLTLENCFYLVQLPLIKMLISTGTNILDIELDLMGMKVFHSLALD